MRAARSCALYLIASSFELSKPQITHATVAPSLVTISRPVDVRSTALRRFSAVDAANRASRGWSVAGAVSGQDAVGSESERTDDRANERCQRSLVPKPKELTRKEGRKERGGAGRAAAEGAGRAIKATRD